MNPVDKLSEEEANKIYPHERTFRCYNGPVIKIRYDSNKWQTMKYVCEFDVDGHKYVIDRDAMIMMMSEPPRLAPPLAPCFESGEDGHLHLVGYKE